MIQIGFIQGRLSPIVNGMIQAFPKDHWQQEMAIAGDNNFHQMEWTLDQQDLYHNPLLTEDGQRQIKALCRTHNLCIPSLTGDCFMQAPFWKAQGDVQAALMNDFRAVVDASIAVGVQMLVVPLVDNGSLESTEQEDCLINYLSSEQEYYLANSLKIVFESDQNPEALARFIARLDERIFGVNYDIGNSAALGYHPKEEFAAYGQRILNLHIKDRLLNGSTVPLGEGNADFETVFAELKRVGYTGNYILQTARAEDGNHLDVLKKYRDMSLKWIENGD